MNDKLEEPWHSRPKISKRRILVTHNLCRQFNWLFPKNDGTSHLLKKYSHQKWWTHQDRRRLRSSICTILMGINSRVMKSTNISQWSSRIMALDDYVQCPTCINKIFVYRCHLPNGSCPRCLYLTCIHK